MKREKGLAYCGLACCVCGENETCEGCRKGSCKNKGDCKNYRCCEQKGIQGCWQCPDFPCTGCILDKVRVRAFARFIAKYGEEKLLQRLERNEESGIVYHYPGQLVGDYDLPQDEKSIILMVLEGREPRTDQDASCPEIPEISSNH